MTITKGYIAKEDLKQWDGSNPTFTRPTSTGGTQTLSRCDVTGGVDVAGIYTVICKRHSRSMGTAC